MDKQLQLVADWLAKKTEQYAAAGYKGYKLDFSNLSIDKYWVENFYDGRALIVIPIGDGGIPDSIRYSDGHYYFVGFQDKNAVIKKGLIVHFLSADGSKSELSKNVLMNFYSDTISDDRFNLDYMSIAGYKLYSFEFENGKILRYKAMGGDGGQSPQKQNIVNDNCIEYYWNTYENGFLVSSVYIGTVCLPEVIDGSGSNGGGGSDGSFIVLRDYNAYSTWGTMGNPTVVSHVRLKGREVSGEPEGGHFESASHEDHGTINFLPYGMQLQDAVFEAWHAPQVAHEQYQFYIYRGVNIPTEYRYGTHHFYFGELF